MASFTHVHQAFSLCTSSQSSQRTIVTYNDHGSTWRHRCQPATTPDNKLNLVANLQLYVAPRYKLLYLKAYKVYLTLLSRLLNSLPLHVLNPPLLKYCISTTASATHLVVLFLQLSLLPITPPDARTLKQTPLCSSRRLPSLDSPLPPIFTVFPPAASHATTSRSKPIPAESMQTRLPSDHTQLIFDVGSFSLLLSLLSIHAGLAFVLLSSYTDQIDDKLVKFFVADFTKKTKVPLAVCPSSRTADEHAEARFCLAIKHTKRTISASPGAAT
ncbi:hypothetical protein C0995_013233 [Termitomyces sp. Mi166|nr:hypothetical protein C0995_013233 [Termitomyces sp. Mi166\